MLNSCCLVGRTTRDPELRYTPNGTAVANVGLAVNRASKDKDEVDFFELTFWGKQAEVAGEHLKKGGLIGLKGRLRQETWETNGQKRSKVGVVVENFQFIGTGGSKSNTHSNGSSSAQQASEPVESSDIPF